MDLSKIFPSSNEEKELQKACVYQQEEEDEEDSNTDVSLNRIVSARTSSVSRSKDSLSSPPHTPAERKMYTWVHQEQQHHDQVNALCFSRDECHLAIGTNDGRVIVYDPSTLRVLEECAGPWSESEKDDSCAIYTVCFSPDGRYLAAGGSYGRVVVFEIAAMKVVHIVTSTGCDGDGDGNGDGEVVRTLLYSHDGKYLAVAGDDKKIVLYNCCPSTTMNMENVYVMDGEIYTLAFSPDDRYLAVGGADNRVVIYEFPAMTVLREHRRTHSIFSVCFSPNGQYLAVAGDDTIVAIYNTSSMDVVQEDEHTWTSWLRAVSFSHDGRFLAAGGYDRKVAIYDVSTMEILKEYDCDGTVHSLCFWQGDDEDDLVLACGWDKKLTMFKSSVTDLAKEHERIGTVRAISFSRDGHYLAVGGYDKKLIFYNPMTMAIVQEHEGSNIIISISFSPKGDCLAMADGDMVVLYDSLTMEVLDEHQREDFVQSVAFAPNGELVGVGNDNRVIIYESSPSQLIVSRMIERNDWIFTASFSPDSKWLAVGGHDSKVTIYDSSKLTIAKEFEMEGWVRTSSYSPNGHYLATAGYDNRITLINTTTMSYAATIEVADAIRCLSFSPDSRFLMSGGLDKILYVYEITDDENVNLQLNQSIPTSESIQALSFFVGELESSQKLQRDFYHIAIGNGNFVNSFNIHKHSSPPINMLMQFKDDKELVNITKDETYKITSHVIQHLIQACITEKRSNLVTSIVQDDPSHALISMDFTLKSNGILSFLMKHHLFDALNALAECPKSFRPHTSLVTLDEMTNVLTNLARNQIKNSVMKFLRACENGSLEGFVSVDTTYLLDERISSGLSNFFSSAKQAILPLTNKLPPRSSKNHNINVDSAWSDFTKDRAKRVELKVLRVLLPNLASFDSLDAFTGMKSNDAFETPALCAAIDANWSNWARTRFLAQTLLYVVWLAIFTSFCEITRTSELMDWKAYCLGCTVIGGVSYFVWYELRQYYMLSIRKYWNDTWNVWHWVSNCLVIATVSFRLYGQTNPRIGAFLSSMSLMSTWLGLFFYLRGFEDCAWITIALLKIASQMNYFVVVLTIAVVSFALGLHALYDDKLDGNDGTSDIYSVAASSAAFGSMRNAVQSTLVAASVIADFDQDDLEKTYSVTFATVIVFVVSLTISLISLNALIAFISDAFEKVLAEKKSVLKRQKAIIIMELYSVLSLKNRERIEHENRWTTIIIPASSLQHSDEEKNTSRATKDDMREMKQKFGILEREMNTMRNELAGMKKEMTEMRKGVDTVLKIMQENTKRK